MGSDAAVRRSSTRSDVFDEAGEKIAGSRMAANGRGCADGHRPPEAVGEREHRRGSTAAKRHSLAPTSSSLASATSPNTTILGRQTGDRLTDCYTHTHHLHLHNGCPLLPCSHRPPIDLHRRAQAVALCVPAVAATTGPAPAIRRVCCPYALLSGE